MGNDAAGAIVVWFLQVVALTVVMSVAAVVGLVYLIGLGLWKAIGLVYDRACGDPLEHELGRIASERQEAIHDIVALRNAGERELRTIADEGVIESTAVEWGHE